MYSNIFNNKKPTSVVWVVCSEERWHLSILFCMLKYTKHRKIFCFKLCIL